MQTPNDRSDVTRANHFRVLAVLECDLSLGTKLRAKETLMTEATMAIQSRTRNPLLMTQ